MSEEPTSQQYSSLEFINHYFPNTIREHEEIDEEVSLSHNTGFSPNINSNADNTLAPMSRSGSNTTLSSRNSEDLNVLFWNIGGYRLGRTSLDRALDRYEIGAFALNETWWRYDLNRADGDEVQNHAREAFRDTT